MKENVKKALIELVKAIALAVAGFVAAVLTTGCGSTTKASVRHIADTATTTISITTNNPSNIEVNPSAKVDSLKFNVK